MVSAELNAARSTDSNILLVKFQRESRMPLGNGPKTFPLIPCQLTNLRLFVHVIRHRGALNLKIIDSFVSQRQFPDNKACGPRRGYHWMLLVKFKEGIWIKVKKAARLRNSAARLEKEAWAQVSKTSRSKKELNSLHTRRGGTL